MGLWCFYGPMFAGKTERLLEYGEETMAVFIKSSLDQRAGENKIGTHNGKARSADLVVRPDEEERLFRVLRGFDVGVGLRPEVEEALAVVGRAMTVCVDEAQFFTTDEFVRWVRWAVFEQGKNVAVAGLNGTFHQRPFGQMPSILSLATHPVELFASCYCCGEDAKYSVLRAHADSSSRWNDGKCKVSGGAPVLVGGSETFITVCPRHLPGKDPRPRVIAIEGNIGVGKTTLGRVLASRYEELFAFVEEPVDYDALGAMYKDPKRYTANYQFRMLTARTRSLRNAVASAVVPIVITDRHVGADMNAFIPYLLGLGNITEHDVRAYEECVRELPDDFFPTVDAIIYLRGSAEVCYDRLKERDGRYQPSAGLDYLRGFHNAMDGWLVDPWSCPSGCCVWMVEGARPPCLVVETDAFDTRLGQNQDAIRDMLLRLQ